MGKIQWASKSGGPSPGVRGRSMGMKKAIPAIAIALAVVGFWVLFRGERSATDEGAAAQHGVAREVGSSAVSRSGPFDSSGMHGSTKDGPPGARSADDPAREDR